MDKLKVNLRRFWFIFRWWLIGRNHCDIPKSLRKFWWICHKITWIIITIAICHLIVVLLGYEDLLSW